MAASAEMGWHWLSSFNGILSMLFVAIIIVVMVALIRDWCQERNALPAAKAGLFLHDVGKIAVRQGGLAVARRGKKNARLRTMRWIR